MGRFGCFGIKTLVIGFKLLSEQLVPHSFIFPVLIHVDVYESIKGIHIAIYGGGLTIILQMRFHKLRILKRYGLRDRALTPSGEHWSAKPRLIA